MQQPRRRRLILRLQTHPIIFINVTQMVSLKTDKIFTCYQFFPNLQENYRYMIKMIFFSYFDQIFLESLDTQTESQV